MTDNPEARKKRTSFLALYGLFLSSWSMFETLMEVLIMRQLGLQPRETSIICAPLGPGAKRNLLVSLLNREPDKYKQAIGLINEAIKIAQRNSFAHGFFRVDLDAATFLLLTRDVKDTY